MNLNKIKKFIKKLKIKYKKLANSILKLKFESIRKKIKKLDKIKFSNYKKKNLDKFQIIIIIKFHPKSPLKGKIFLTKNQF